MRQYHTRKGMRVPADLPKVANHPERWEWTYGTIIVPAARTLLRLQGIQITVDGAEHIPTDGPALLAVNHTGYYDFILAGIPAYLRGRRLVRVMAKKPIFDTPIVGTLMRHMRHISVDREPGKGSASADEAVRRLGQGELVGIFPEATVSRSFEIKHLKTGAARIAMEADVPLIPVVILGSQRIWTKELPKRLGRSNIPIHIRVGAPIERVGSAEEITARLRKSMQDLLERNWAAYDDEHGPFEDGLAWIPVSRGGSAPTIEQADRIDKADKAAIKERKAAKNARREAKKVQRKAKKAARAARRIARAEKSTTSTR